MKHNITECTQLLNEVNVVYLVCYIRNSKFGYSTKLALLTFAI